MGPRVPRGARGRKSQFSQMLISFLVMFCFAFRVIFRIFITIQFLFVFFDFLVVFELIAVGDGGLVVHSRCRLEVDVDDD